jgi:hypothetical protein
VSEVRSAGMPPIITVPEPLGNGLAVGWCAFGGNEHTCWSVATAAGMLPISTVDTPGPTIVPP